LLEQVFFTDGTQYKVFRWDEDGAQEVVAYESKTAGKVQENCRLITNWRGRIVLAHNSNDPQNWFMSAKDDPYDWDYYPPVVQSTQAIAGNVARAGRTPDIINALVPYNDDLLFFGCDHSLWRLSGDPMQGGEIDLVSDITGMAFGRSWTKDPEGRVYFFGSRGGVYVMATGGLPQRLSLHRIERRMQDVDLSANYMELVWNYKDEGLHVFQFPYGSGGTAVRHWFWEQKTGAWWEDEFGTSADTSVQPTAVVLLDGDAFDDRVIVLGHEDGYLRKWDPDSYSDKQTATSDRDPTVAIDSRVLYGPFHTEGAQREMRFSRIWSVMADDQGPVNFELFAQPVPDVLGNPRVSGTFQPGQNGSKPARARGSYVNMRLRNAALNQRWSVETVAWEAHAAGRVRSRSRR
jgi:hypothetical protein